MKVLRYFAVILIIMMVKPVFACYLSLNGSNDYINDNAFLFNTFKKYVRDVKESPIDGISMDACYYNVDVEYKNNMVYLSISGEMKHELAGHSFENALLSLFFRQNKEDMCEEYPRVMYKECNYVAELYFITVGKQSQEKPPKGKPFAMMIDTYSEMHIFVVFDYGNGIVKILWPERPPAEKLFGKKIIPTNRILIAEDPDSYKVFIVYSSKVPENLFHLMDVSKFNEPHVFVKEIK